MAQAMVCPLLVNIVVRALQGSTSMKQLT